MRFVSILREAGLPKNGARPAWPAIIKLQKNWLPIPGLAFSALLAVAKVGWMLRSKLAPGTRCALEHGGSAPVIVAADADTR